MKWLMVLLFCSVGMAKDPVPPKWEVTRDDDGKAGLARSRTIVTITDDGNVTLGPNISPNEASMEFWKAVRRNKTCACKEAK